jgi:hypothetical protein
MGLLRVYALLGDEKFEELIQDVERLYKIFTLEGEAHNLDVKFMFI